MKKLVVWLMIFSMLGASAASAATKTKQLKMEAVSDKVFYLEDYNRYINNAAAFSVDRAEAAVEQIKAMLEGQDQERHVPVYLYFVESSRSHQIAQRFSVNSPLYSYLKKELKLDGIDHLKYTTFQQFCKYFYATDHHWNYRGSYQGYKDIVRMLLGKKEKALRPLKAVMLPVIYNGSFSKLMKNPVSEEKFVLYQFIKLPAYSCLVNGKKRPYDHIADYLKEKCRKDTYANHYELCYGAELGLAVMDTAKKKKKNLLLISNSMGSAVKPLLIGHYHRIVCVDPRFYEESAGKPFSLRETIAEYGIDQVLILGDAQFFMTEDVKLAP